MVTFVSEVERSKNLSKEGPKDDQNMLQRSFYKTFLLILLISMYHLMCKVVMSQWETYGT